MCTYSFVLVPLSFEESNQILNELINFKNLNIMKKIKENKTVLAAVT